MSSGPTGSVILGLYEQGMTASAAIRAELLARAGGCCEPRVTLGDADRAAWQFLTDQFGASQDAVLTCSACGEDVEFTLPPDFSPHAGKAKETVHISHKGRDYDLRMPDLSDLSTGRFDPRELCPNGDWSDHAFREACQAALLVSDPALKLDLSLTCAACGSEQTHVFDVTGYVWARLEQAARALVRDVAALARGYGWSEAEITAMSGARRAIYLRELGE